MLVANPSDLAALIQHERRRRRMPQSRLCNAAGVSRGWLSDFEAGKAADFVRDKTMIEPQVVIREGQTATELLKLIEDDEDIAVLVLAASMDKEGPGPLVTALAGKAAGTFPVPITLVPGQLDDETIEAIA